MGALTQGKGAEWEEKEEHRDLRNQSVPSQGRMGEAKLTDRCRCLDKELVAGLAHVRFLDACAREVDGLVLKPLAPRVWAVLNVTTLNLSPSVSSSVKWLSNSTYLFGLLF